MDLTDYTTFDEVRSALGVDSSDLPDETLQLRRYLTEVEIGLEEVGSTVITQYKVISDKETSARTDAESLVYDRTRLCATYLAAAACLSGLPLFVNKSETDEKSSYTRFTGNVIEQVSENIRASLERYRAALQNAVSSLENGSSVVRQRRTFIYAVPSNYDPVTGS